MPSCARMRFFSLGSSMEKKAALAAWVADYLPPGFALGQPVELAAVTGDAGFRQYFRVNSHPTLIAVYAPPSHEDVPAFVAKDLAMKAAGVGVPEVYAVDYGQGFILQQDLGHQLLLPLLMADSAPRLYRVAERELEKIQQVAPDPAVFPPYDRATLNREMALFPEWFVTRLLGVTLAAADTALLARLFTLLEDAALAQPRVVVHRDYHSRNLLVGADGSLGVIDFQDALVGPFSYDLVSLLKDCYIRWPAALVRERALAFLEQRARALGLHGLEGGELLRWFDLMGLQRHLKVLGIFARLWLRDGKPGYLSDLPLVLRYTLEVAQDYPELEFFTHWFTERLHPCLPGQPWYRSWQSAGA